MYSPRSKVRKKNKLPIFLTFGGDFCRAVDEVLAPVVEATAEPSGAALAERLEETFGPLFEAEADAGPLLIEGGGGLLAGSLATQGGLNLAAEDAVEGYAADVAGDKWLCVGGEAADVVGQQVGVVCLPLVAVGLCVGMGEACLEVGGLVQEDPEEEGLGC